MEPRPQKGITGRPATMMVVALVFFIIMLLKLWSLQIVSAGRYREMGRSNTIRRIILKPERGSILDRNGIPLAANRIRFDASVDYGKLMGKREVRERAVEALSSVLGISPEEIRKDLEPRRVIPYISTKIKREITREEFLQLKILESEIPGLKPEVQVSRNYPYGELASHVLGYTGAIPADKVEQYKKRGYLPDDIVGIAGIEYTYEAEFQGKKGSRLVEVDNKNRLVSVLDDTDKPVSGNDVSLALDLGLQTIVEQAFGEHAGAVVVVDPRNGDVLAMVNKPAFDPNIFTTPRSDEDVEAIRRMLTDNENQPAHNRAISRPYPLGSAFKVVTALAALGCDDPEKRITLDTTYECRGSFRLGRAKPWRCYHGHSHGEMNVVSAIQKSCNVFFYNVGHRIGRDPIVDTADRLGLGKITGIELPSERPGVNPTEEWRNSDDWRATPEYRHWYPGHTVNISIGQYPIEVTPVQVAMLYSVIANGGTLYRPRLVTKIIRPDEEITLNPRGTYLGIPPDHIATVKEGLSLVTKRGGTAYSSFRELQHLNAAGKTSTAEPGKNMDWAYTWFVAFAPVEKPEILVVVLVEKGTTGGTTSAPIAAEILRRYYEE